MEGRPGQYSVIPTTSQRSDFVYLLTLTQFHCYQVTLLTGRGGGGGGGGGGVNINDISVRCQD